MDRVGQGYTLFGPWVPMAVEPKHCLSSQKVDVTSKAVAEVLVRTIEYLQPNPGRASLLSGVCPGLLCQQESYINRAQRGTTEPGWAGCRHGWIQGSKHRL